MLSFVSKIAGLGLIEVVRAHDVLTSQPIKTLAGSFDIALNDVMAPTPAINFQQDLDCFYLL